MILFASDFGHAGPYVGQVHAVLARHAPGVPVIDLMHDLPTFRPEAAGCLLRAIMRSLVIPMGGAPRDRSQAPGNVVLAVVDPGVGTARDPIIVEAGGTRFVGPDNGLFADVVAGSAAQAWRIDWRPEHLSNSFHGRDLFAPVAAMLAQGRPVDCTEIDAAELVRNGRQGALTEVIYCDGYGNAITGIEAEGLGEDVALEAGGQKLLRARTFDEVPAGYGFWYANSLGLAEIAVNRGNAAAEYGLGIGTPVIVRV